MESPLIQTQAVKEYNKASKGSIKLYPSLELVRLEKKFFTKKNSKILEYGFGGGSNTIHLLKRNYKIFGIDAAKGMVKITKERVKKNKLSKRCELKLLKADMNKLPYKDKFFDYIVAMSVLSLLGSRIKIQYLLSEFKRILKPKGRLILDINDHKSEFASNKRQIEKNVFVNKSTKNKSLRYFCLKNEKEFIKIVQPFFLIKDVGFSSHKLFGREITEFIISAENSS